ncbi:hypothetical protein MW350_004314 [Vibrio parahaemolyticus]|nr:hypothetical protein [Vibrio parahaemolyticus]
MYHTSPNKIESGLINNNGVAGSCLFFSDDVYVMTASNCYYVYEADFDCIRASQLHDDEIIADISRYFDVDESTAESLLDSTQSEWCLDDFDCEGEDSWWLQGKRGECAVKMGYDGCEDKDEQGTVYIIPMLGREDELKLVEVVNG